METTTCRKVPTTDNTYLLTSPALEKKNLSRVYTHLLTSLALVALRLPCVVDRTLKFNY